MSGVLSGVGKVFSAVGNTAAKVTKSIAGIGATMFTAGAATGAPAIAQGGLSNMFGSGTLGKIMQGAVSRAIPGALMGGAVGALSGQGFMKGAMMGGLGGAAFGGAEGAGLFRTSSMQNTASDPWGGMRDSTGSMSGASGIDVLGGGAGDDLLQQSGTPSVPVQKSGRYPSRTVSPESVNWDARTGSAPAIDAAGAIERSGGLMPGGQQSQSGGLFQKGLDFLGTERGGQLLAGLGKGGMEYLQARQIAQEKEKDRQFLRDKQQTITNSYKGTVGQSSAVGNATKQMQTKPRYMFDPGVGRIVMQ